MPVAGSPLRGRTAVVTGAARGLGAALARELSARGAKVALLGREERTLAEVRDTLPGVCECWEVDVTDDRAPARVGEAVRERLGSPSVVVANAGVAEGGPFAESDPAVWRRVVEVNLIGSAATARTFVRDLFDTSGYRTLAQCSTLQGGGGGHPARSGPKGRSGMAKIALSDDEVVGPTAGRAGSQACGGRAGPTLTGRRWPVKQEPEVVPRSGTDRNLLPSGRRGRQFLQVASLASIGAAPMMSAYCASKAGVESFAHALRAEVAHRRVGVGIAYINWTDTDMVRDADEHAVLRELRGHMPPPARRVHPVGQVADRLVTAVERRRPSVYVPGWLRAAQLVRAAMPPVVTALSRRELPRLAAAEPFRATGLLGAGGRADRDADAGGPPG